MNNQTIRITQNTISLFGIRQVRLECDFYLDARAMFPEEIQEDRDFMVLQWPKTRYAGQYFAYVCWRPLPDDPDRVQLNQNYRWEDCTNGNRMD
jgi:hypothetical protein